MSSLQRWVTNGLLALAGTAMALGMAEVAARIAVRSRGGGKEQDELAGYIQADPSLGWRKRPGARVTYRRREYTVEVQINSTGLRDVERTLPKPPGVYRILAVGDSFIEGYSVAVERTVTQKLEQSLTTPTCPVEVLNGGTAAYSTDQEYLFFLQDGARYHPDVVVLFFYYNDVMINSWSNSWGMPKPLLWMSAPGRPVIANFPVPPPTIRAPAAQSRERQVTGSAAVAWVKERLRRGAPGTFNRLARLGLWSPVERGGSIDPGDQMRVYKRHRQPPVEEAWNLTAGILFAFAREAAARRARFLVAYVPNRFEVSDGDWELTRIHYGLEPGTWDRGLVRERLEMIGRSAGFPVLDLTPALRAADHGLLGGPYFTFDGHWNERGHEVAAQATKDWLAAEGWLPPCSTRTGL